MRCLLLLLIFFISNLTFGQDVCVNHWTQNSVPNFALDSILSTINFKNTDSIPCLQSGADKEFDHKQLIDFYNDQLGNYFSEAISVNFAEREYKKTEQQTFDEVKVVQFELPTENIRKLKKAYGKGYDGYRYFKLNILTLYKFVIIENNVFFISTVSYHPGEKDSFLDKVVDIFLKSSHK